MDFLEVNAAKNNDSVKINRSSVDQLWDHVNNNPTLSSCITCIDSRLLGPGFRFSNQDGRQPNELFDRHVRKYFFPFIHRALECILVQGFCVYGIKNRSVKHRYPVPFVYSREVYDIVMTTKKGEDQMSVIARGEDNKNIGKMFIFIDRMPSQNGNLTSRVSKVAKIINYVNEIEKHDIQSFALRSRPPVLTKTHTDTSFDSRDVISGAVPGLRAQDENDNMEIRNKITIQQFRQQHDLITTLNKERIDSSESFWSNHLDPNKNTYLSNTLKQDVDGFVPRFVPLPNDADVAKYDLPVERKDFVQLQKFCKTQICVGMGVPEACIDGQFSGSSSALSSKMTEEFIRVSLMPLRTSLTDLLLEVYEKGIGEDTNIDCIFPGVQSVDRLFFWYQNGLLKRGALIDNISDIENLNNGFFINEKEALHMNDPTHNPNMQKKRKIDYQLDYNPELEKS